MDRRTYVVGVGSVAIAGCLGGSDEDEETTSEQAESPSAGSDSEPQEGSQSQAGSDSEPEESSQSQDGSQPEEDPEQDPDSRQESSDEVELERSIYRAEEQFRLALREYGKSTGQTDATFLHVLPSTEVETNNARSYLDEAIDILWEDAHDYATTEEEHKRVREYRTYDDLIWNLVQVQRSIHKAYLQIDSPEDATAYSNRPAEFISAKNDYERLGEKMAEKEIYMSELQTKYDQQGWQIELLERTFSGLVNIESTRRINTQPSIQLQLARNEFTTVIRLLEDTTSAPPEDTTDQEFLALVQEWYELTDEVLRER